VPKLAPRDLANAITMEALSYMQVEPNSDEAKMVRMIVDQMVMPAPPAKPASSKPAPQVVPRFKQ